MKLATESAGYYKDEDLNPEAAKRANVFTVYVCYPFDKAALALDNDGLLSVFRAGDASVEEIDVLAANEQHAREIAEAAIKLYYEPDGRIVWVEERVPGTLYL